MIHYTQIQRHENLPFQNYLELGGYSHSFLKSQKNGITPYFKVTDKVRLGSLVDALLTQDDRFDYADPLSDKAISIASQIKHSLGASYRSLKPQISYTGIANLGAFQMKVTGRLDWEIPKHAVLDLKVTGAKSDREFAAYIDHMGYKNQLWNYAKLAGLKRAYILAFSVPANKCLSLVSVEVGDRNEFWESKIMEFGSVVNNFKNT